jgi:fatty-acyl-CoA synthase
MKLEFITILQQFHNTVAKRKDYKAITFEDHAYTWEELDILSDKLAIRLLSDGITKGAHVALCGRNSTLWICAFLAVLKSAAIPVLINPKLKELELQGILDFADVEFQFYDQEAAGFETGTERIGSARLDQSLLESIISTPVISYSDRGKLNLRQMEIYPEDMACMLFTSGTTSKPKGVMLSHYQLINIARETVEALHWNSQDKVCLALPMFHCFGLSAGLLAAFVHGGSLHITNGHKSGAVMECIAKNSCTVFNSVPSLFLAILHNKDRSSYSLNSLRSGIIAGSDVHTSDFLLIAKELGMEGLMQSYGQTEASPSITFSDSQDSLELRSRSVGRKISNIEMKIVDPLSGMPLATYQPGEILIKGYNVMKGYYKNETETKAALTEDGWLRTGDIGYLDEEENLYITGRKKDIIIRCGENISPKEIEETILDYENAAQVKVFGIPMPVVQEEIVACVISKEGKLSVPELRAFLGKRLADYKIPKIILPFQQFPTNDSGKIDLKKLKEEADQILQLM